MNRSLLFGLLMLALSVSAQNTYKNPVYGSDFPDPSVQRGQDGYFYVYATGQRCLRSTDLVNWERLDNVISRPTWNDSTYVDANGEKQTDYYSFWACDVNYVDGKYLMYYACALWGNGSRTGIGAATGTVPTRFKDKGKLFRSTEIGVENSIDPCYVEEGDKKYLVWGSFNGIYISELAADGLSIKNPKAKTRIAGTAFEGAMIHKHGSYYYLFGSVGSCCEGERSSYHTVVGRASKLTGPYVNREGASMLDNNYTTIIKGNDRWRGPGHNSEIITDDEGTDWIMYHSYDMNNDCDGRLLMLDKITWDKAGWPVVNDGCPSSDAQEAPVFYKNDGSVRTYKLMNADFSKSKWNGWEATFSEGANQGTGAGSTFMPFGFVKGSCTFDISQTVNDLPNGLYEVDMNAFDTEDNVDICINGLPTMIHDSTFTSSYPSTNSAVASMFLRDLFLRKAYGVVYNGKLVLQFHSRNPLTATEHFYVGNLRLTYRYRNEAVQDTVLQQYNRLVDDTYAAQKPFSRALRTTVDDARAATLEATTATTQYNKLVIFAKAVANMQASIAVYDSLAQHTAQLQEQIADARQGGYLTDEAAGVLAEAQEVLKSQDYTDSSVKELISRMKTASDHMQSNYQLDIGAAESSRSIKPAEQPIYDLTGRRIERSMVNGQKSKDKGKRSRVKGQRSKYPKGIYIASGKKLMIQ